MKTTHKHTIITSVLAAMALGLTSCATPSSGSSTSGVKPYPLKTCIVTDNDLGSMGDETRIVHEGREIKFCCAPCESKFLKNPAKYLSKL